MKWISRASRRGTGRWAARWTAATHCRAAVGPLLGLLLAGPVGFLAADLCFPFPEETLKRPAGRIVTDREGRVLRMFLAPDGYWRFPVRSGQVQGELVQALLTSEDQWFYFHPGVNPLSVLRACWSNLLAGRIVSGASTIPMQVARMIEPRERRLASKAVEAFRALQLSLRYSKDEVLELYLNLTPYGGNIEGVQAAAYFYFGKPPDQLALGEIALLTALPRSPLRYDPTRNARLSKQARDRVVDQLQARGLFSTGSLATARSLPLPTVRRKAPFRAPHFSELVERESTADVVRSTLDLQIQTRAERQVDGWARKLRLEGIDNVSVVVLDSPTRDVLAMVGSSGYFEATRDGQVNGSLARRSPGSALKPFLFAQAFDSGRIVPESLLLDVPSDYSGYVPENYDSLYRGQVTATQALVQSLNVPAVRLLAGSGLESFHELLVAGGLSTLDRPYHQYGLPLVLGAGEVRLLDLTNLYACLAEGGLYRPFRIIAGPDLSPATRLFSREATSWTNEILGQLQRPDLPHSWELSPDIPAVAWKTGTSFGHRDAWAIGFSGRTTIGVWVGNFDGRSQLGLSGAEHAGPLLFDLFRAIEPAGSSIPALKGLEMGRLKVCASSRQLPHRFCPETREVRYLPGRSIFKTCPQHRQVFVDRQTGKVLRGECLVGRSHRTRVVSQLPRELVTWRRTTGQSVEVVPEVSSDCHTVGQGSGPLIVSPDPGTPYVLRSNVPSRFQKIALTARSSLSQRLYWYADGTLVASGPAGQQQFLEPTRGSHEIIVMDDSGRSDRIVYRVE